MSVQIRRAYVDPAADDGHRVLVDRVWPRGRTKAQLQIERWARDLGPSTELRRWFGHDPVRWEEFRERYQAELTAPGKAALLDELADAARRGRVTLVYGARDEEHNQAVVLAGEIERRLKG